MAQTTSVLWSVDQGLGEKAKEQARQNIGAASEKLTEVVNNHTEKIEANTEKIEANTEKIEANTEKIEANTTEIGQITESVEGIESSLANKKDRQTELNFGGSATKTVKSITQDANGVINVEYENIDFVRGNSNIEIKSEDNSVNVVESTDSQTNIKTYDISVADSVKSKIKDITISNDTLVIIGG